jgi:hypothetical protein
MPGHRRLHERVSVAINTGSEAADSEIANLRAEISRLHDPAELENFLVLPEMVRSAKSRSYARPADPTDCARRDRAEAMCPERLGVSRSG